MTTRHDEEIRQAVMWVLGSDTSVESAEIVTHVDRGVVTLTGIAGSWLSRIAAQEAVHRVTGVLDVVNNVEVNLAQESGRNDADIARAVRKALEWNVLVPDLRIHATVSGGQVRLTGDVDYWSERDDAELAIRELDGVREVVNEIVIKPTQPASHEVKKAIEDALERYADQCASRLRLEVHGGKVTLFGAVSSAEQWQVVLHVARNTPGVRTVDDHLVVEEPSAGDDERTLSQALS